MPDPWRPDLGCGAWRVWYAECCDALLAFDRVVATLPAGQLRDGVAASRADLLPLLASALRTAELGAYLDPDGPARPPALVELLAADPMGDLGDRLGPSPTGRLRERIERIRGELTGIADEAARLAARLHEHPHATDVAVWLAGLAEGVAQARRAAFIPSAYRVEGER